MPKTIAKALKKSWSRLLAHPRVRRFELYRPARQRALLAALVVAVIGGLFMWRTMASPNPNLIGDLNGDNKVNLTDLSILLSNWGKTTDIADLNNDGKVTLPDLSLLLSNWGKTYTPPTPPPTTPPPTTPPTTPPPTPPAPAPPTNLEAITGGDSIALLWDMPDRDIKSVEVYRNDTKIATVTPNTGVIHSDRLGKRYIDKSVTRGTSYSYKVRAVSTQNVASVFTASVSATHPTNTTPVPTVTIDASQAPDLADYLNTQAKPEIETWIPKISDAIAFPDYTPFPNIRLYMDPANTGVAYVGGSMPAGTISVNPEWLRNNKEDGGGMFLHESTHIVQGYGPNVDPVPGWVTEGIADWTRDWFTRERFYLPRPTTQLGAYSEGAFALEWGSVKYRADLIRKINVAAHKGEYTDELTSDLTDHTAEELFAEAKQQHYGATGEVNGIGGKCMDILNAGTAVGTKLQLYSCNDNAAQQWTIMYRDAGLHGTTKKIMHLVNTAVLPDGRCLDVVNSGTASGTKVHSWDCNLGLAQEWTQGANGSLINPNSGKCLSTTGGGSEDGNQLIIADCDGSAAQRWTLPQ